MQHGAILEGRRGTGQDELRARLTEVLVGHPDLRFQPRSVAEREPSIPLFGRHAKGTPDPATGTTFPFAGDSLAGAPEMQPAVFVPGRTAYMRPPYTVRGVCRTCVGEALGLPNGWVHGGARQLALPAAAGAGGRRTMSAVRRQAPAPGRWGAEEAGCSRAGWWGGRRPLSEPARHPQHQQGGSAR